MFKNIMKLYPEEKLFSGPLSNNDGIVSYLSLRFENESIMQCKTQKLRLIEPDKEEMIYPDVQFSSIINLPSPDFQKIIRDLSSISDRVEIESVGNESLARSLKIHALDAMPVRANDSTTGSWKN